MHRSSSLPIAIRLACAGLVGLAAVVPAHGQPSAPLSLETVFAATLDRNADVRAARTTVDSQRGALVQTHDPFDVRPRASLTNTRTRLNSGGIESVETPASYWAFGTESALGAARLFRSGVEVTSAVSMVRTSPFELDGPTWNQFGIAGSVRVPLLRGSGGGMSSALERGAGEDLSAAERAFRFTAASALLRATLAYWEYRAAYTRAEILDAAARRSNQSVEELTILIQADERPRSDIDLMMANAAAKRALAMQANRQIIHARTELALAIGAEARDGAMLAAPATAFPTPETAVELPFEPTLAETLARHDQLAALVKRKERARLIHVAAARELRPRVDLLFTTGYTGQVAGRGVSRLFSSFYRNVLGPNGSLQLVYEPLAASSVERGALIQADAEYARATEDANALTRTIALTLADALAGLSASRAQLGTTEEAVQRSRLALATVHRNFELGTATVFDRILAEDTVTNAELADLAAQRDCAAAIAQVQFARGVLLDPGGTLAADARRVLRVSLEDGR